MIFKFLVLASLAIIIAYLYQRWSFEREITSDEIEQSVISAWNASIKLPSRRFGRISVGVNSNVDLIVSGIQLLKSLDAPAGNPRNHNILTSVREFQETFSFFFSKGMAAERAFADPEVYSHIIDVANGLTDKQYYIGGNAALMAEKVVSLFPDIQIQYVGPVGPKLRELMPPSITIPDISNIAQDEVHLIMEYGLADEWGEVQTPVANRFIASYDESNSKMTMLEKFFSSLETFKPDLVLMSGLHLLEGQTTEFFVERIKALKEGLNFIPKNIPIHLELASMASRDFVEHILDQVAPAISSLGLNEQELSFASYTKGGPHQEDFLKREGQPEIHKIVDMMLWLLQTYGQTKNRINSKLTRVHFHSLTYHIVGVVPMFWRNNKAAVSAGAQMAGLQACSVESLNPQVVDLKIPFQFKLFSGDIDRKFNENDPVTSWDLEGFHFVFSPVLVCKNPLKTVGLGDSISATGLMYSEFYPHH